MNYRIENKPALALTGVALRATTRDGQNFREIPAFWEQSKNDGSFAELAAAMPKGSPIGIAGVCAEFDESVEAFSYFIAVETPEDRAGLPDGSRDLAVPAATWGIFEARGPLPGSIQEVTKRIFGEWFPTSGWEPTEGPQLEIYSPGDTSAADYYCEVWVPLKKAAGA